MNITIRPVRLEDAPAVQHHAAHPEVAATCNVPHPYPPDGGTVWTARSVQAWLDRSRFPFVILNDNAFAGVITLNAPDFGRQSFEVDYWVAREFWGRGIATSAIRHALRHGFLELNLSVARSGCWDANPASAKALLKNGFREAASETNQGRYGQKLLGQTIRRFELTRPEWELRSRC